MRAARQKQEQIICRKSGLAVILLLVELARSCSLFVNLKERGERKEVKRGEGGKKSGFDSSVKDSRDTNDVLRTERDIPDSCCEFQTRPSVAARHSPDPSWPHRWTFEKQSLESVPSNGFIKEVIILQQGRRCQWEIK